MEEKRVIPIREGIFRIPSEAGEAPRLLGSRCRSCGTVAFPPRALCASCHAEEAEPVSLSTRGSLYSYTIVGYAPPGMEAPYAIGYVDLPEGVRVFSILTGWKEKGLKVGMDLELVLGRLKEDKDGNEIVTYKFRPV